MKLRVGNNVFLPECEKAREEIQKHTPGEIVHVEIADKDPGTINMLRTWHGWMGETAAHMRSRGARINYTNEDGVVYFSREFRGDDAHDLFTAKYLGTDEEGNRKTWSMTRKEGEKQASIGDRLWAMDRHLDWCTEKGWKLTIPRNSEYTKLKQEQGEAA